MLERFYSNIFVHSQELINPLSGSGFGDSLQGFLKGVLGIAMYIGVPVIGVVLVYAGFKFLLARGNSDKINEATYNISWVLVGIAAVLGAWALTLLIDSTISNIISN